MKRFLPILALCVTALAPSAGAQMRHIHLFRHGDEPPATEKRTDFDISPLDTQVLGQRDWLRGGRAALRVIVTNQKSGAPVHATVTLSLTKLENGKPAGSADI